jgi:Flp pilus assembly protein TadG
MDMRSTFRRMFDLAMALARNQSSARDEEGSAIMETAMSMIILLTFMFGVMEAGFAIYSYHFISEAAREGTRYATVRGSSAGAACGTSYSSYDCMASSGNIQSYVQFLGYPGINPANMTVTSVWSAYAAGNSCPTSPPCNSPGNLVTVTVTYNFPLNVPFIPPHTYAMSSSAAMVIQQ